MCITHAQLLVVEKQPTRILQDINAYIPIVLFDMLFGNAHAKKQVILPISTTQKKKYARTSLM
jgi:hypothetical protein